MPQLTRRAFAACSLACAASVTASHLALAQTDQTGETTHPDIAAIDHLRILVAVDDALAHPPVADRSIENAGWLRFTQSVPALAAGCVIKPAEAAHLSAVAETMLKTWLLDPATKPVLALESYKQLEALAALAEVLVAVPFLTLDDRTRLALGRACANLTRFMTEDTTALLSRDAKNHHQSAWLLTVAALARYTANEAVMTDAKHRFRAQMIRAQINATGAFLHEITGEYPYRDSLWNLDLLAGAAQLLSTRFDSIWNYELQDGPGLRSAIAYHAPFMRNRSAWPHPADLDHFNELPCRRPALVFAGRAYNQPDYIKLWRTLPPDPTSEVIRRTFPIRQPLLWLTQPAARSA